MTQPSGFWDALAPHHAAIEDNYLDRRSLRRILLELREPILVVGAGQGLLMDELRRNGFRSDGVDLSPAMIRYARSRRGLDIVQADARALPFQSGAYQTILYATGVVDFIDEEDRIQAILAEGRRVLAPSGGIFVAFYHMSRVLEEFLEHTGLLRNHRLAFRQLLENYRLTPVQTLAWMAQRAGVSRWRAATLLFRSGVFSTLQEKRAAMNMQKIFRHDAHAEALIQAAPETLPYRNEREIRNLFERLAIPIRNLETTKSCHFVRI